MKSMINHDISKAESSKKYWAKNDYDILQGKFCDQAKETDFVSKRDDEAKVHGKNEVKKLPITVQM